jgi:hypothetical protein
MVLEKSRQSAESGDKTAVLVGVGVCTEITPFSGVSGLAL